MQSLPDQAWREMLPLLRAFMASSVLLFVVMVVMGGAVSILSVSAAVLGIATSVRIMSPAWRGAAARGRAPQCWVQA